MIEHHARYAIHERVTEELSALHVEPCCLNAINLLMEQMSEYHIIPCELAAHLFEISRDWTLESEHFTGNSDSKAWLT